MFTRRFCRRGALTLLMVSCLFATVLLPSSPAHAQARPDQAGEETVTWKPHWSRFRTGEYVATGSLITATVFGNLYAPSGQVRWNEKNGFDESVRNGLRLGTPAARATAGEVSDVLLWSLVAMPYLDATLAGVAHNNWDVAFQMSMINTESFAVTEAVVTLVKSLSGRARPYVRDCVAEGRGDDPECLGTNHAASFLSGHTAMAFTSAGLMCAHHTNLPLYGGGAPDYLACVGALGAAAATGFMRMAADKHHGTDVIAGAALGTLSGWVLPNLLHYGFGSDPEESSEEEAASSRSDFRASVLPIGGPSHIGLGVSGVF